MSDVFSMCAARRLRNDPYTTMWVSITPDLARWIMANCNTRNRKKKLEHIKRMAQAMKKGHYLVTHQGVAFSRSGVLLDGQNRLQAIIDSGVDVTMLVTFDLPEKSQVEMDTGIKRHDVDALTLGYDLKYPVHVVAGMKAMLTQGNSITVDRADLAKFITDQREVADFLSAVFPSRDGAYAGVLGAIGRAYYHVSEERLREFVDIYLERRPWTPATVAAYSLSKYRNGMKNRARFQFQIAQRAIDYFAKGREVKALKPEASDLFPILDGQAEVEMPKPLIQRSSNNGVHVAAGAL